MKKSTLIRDNNLLESFNIHLVNVAETQRLEIIKLKSELEECRYNIKGLIEENRKLKNMYDQSEMKFNKLKNCAEMAYREGWKAAKDNIQEKKQTKKWWRIIYDRRKKNHQCQD